MLNDEYKAFIAKHIHHDTSELMLKARGFDRKTMGFLINQIKARQKVAKKLPFWVADDNIVFPPTTNLEQSSSELTARYKRSLVSEGSVMADLTGGFGIDAYYIGSAFTNVDIAEPNEELLEISRHNLNYLAPGKFYFHHTTAEKWLEHNQQQFDFIYLDPSRRTSSGRKAVLLKDYAPDVVALLPLLYRKSNQVLIKTAPLLDIKHAISLLEGVKKVHIVSTHHEVKEVLYELEKGYTDAPEIIVSDLTHYNTFSFTYGEEKEADITYGPPSLYIYEPHPGIMKSGAFKLIAKAYDLVKLAPDSHLYTGNQLIKGFPGKCYLTGKICKASEKEIAKATEGGKVQIVTKNFPANPDALYKKWRLERGDDYRVFVTQLEKGRKVAIVCRLKK